MPPLRERREEIPALTDYFVKKYSVQYNKALTDISTETMKLLMEYEWPGNIRELENLIKRSVVLGAEAPVRKEIFQRIAALAKRIPVAPPVMPDISKANGTAVAARAPATTAEALADAADEAGNHSLKDISRTAAREAEREVISRMLQRTRWNRKETAAILGISYKALLYKIKENGLDKAS
jgi:DNA-binding NtrC family response regulator